MKEDMNLLDKSRAVILSELRGKGGFSFAYCSKLKKSPIMFFNLKCLETNETLERWQFDIHVDKEVTIDSKPKEKSIKEIRKDIGAVIRQITASVTFLPLLEVG